MSRTLTPEEEVKWAERAREVAILRLERAGRGMPFALTPADDELTEAVRKIAEDRPNLTIDQLAAEVVRRLPKRLADARESWNAFTKAVSAAAREAGVKLASEDQVARTLMGQSRGMVFSTEAPNDADRKLEDILKRLARLRPSMTVHEAATEALKEQPDRLSAAQSLTSEFVQKVIDAAKRAGVVLVGMDDPFIVAAAHLAGQEAGLSLEPADQRRRSVAEEQLRSRNHGWGRG
jgi:hypothetical protein